MNKKILIAIIIIVIATLLLLGILIKTAEKPRITEGKADQLLDTIKNSKSIMWIGPHPDDENSVAGTLALACGHYEKDCYVFALSLIENIQPEGEPASPYEIKARQEAVDWLEATYLKEYIILPGGREGKTAEQIYAQVKSIINEKKPDIILTFSPYGYYGHPDHQVTSKALTKMVNELDYRPKLYYVINTDQEMKVKHFEHEKYPPTDFIDLKFYSDKLGKTAWDAKIEIHQKYATSVPLVTEMLSDQKLQNTDKREYFKSVFAPSAR